MKTEYEIRVLEIDVDKMIKKLDSLGATKVGEWEQKRYVYDFIPKRENQWIRLRTNGKESTLTYKNVEKDTIDGTKELEIVVDDFKKTNEMLEILGYKSKGYQENNRIRYMLNGVEIDIDSWPKIPTYMEIEGKDEEEVNATLELLDIDKEKVTALNCEDIYKKICGINIDEIKNLVF
jgi:adenylate cyclase class 2